MALWCSASMAEIADMMKSFVIGGTSSGVGKTTVTLALMAAFRKRGLVVQPFKCGPDFIDPGHHTRICGRASRNLDGWMLSAEQNRSIFYHHASGADACIVEGVMGLFDGVDGTSDTGSTAEIARLLELPVVLVVDASAIGRSVAALVSGFEGFDSRLHIAGVVFNRTAGVRHYQMLRDAVASSCKTVPLGHLPEDSRIRIPERHLGLFTAGEDVLSDSELALLGGLAETHIELEKLVECSQSFLARAPLHASVRYADVCIGVARDRAFCFYYEDNLDVLRSAGAEILEFSPLRDSCLPEGVDAVYLGGGYPELYAEALGANTPMIASVQSFAQEGGIVYAECGGLMYLSEEIVSHDWKSFPMAAVLPIRVQMTDRLVDFGYAEVCLTADCFWGAAGTRARGHSFHYSTLTHSGPLEHAYRVRYAFGSREASEGFRRKNVLASYVHLHFLSEPAFAASFVENVRRWKSARAAKVAR
jgi:cobyrinic acid a,c-diamide synthase